MKKGIIVIGPESSGTRNLTRLLISAGFAGDSGHEQRFFNPEIFKKEKPEKFVIRTSVPHDNQLIDFVRLKEVYENLNYKIYVLITSRDWNCMLQSQVNAGHTDTLDNAEERTRLALSFIYEKCFHSKISYNIVSYESLVNYPKETLGFLEKLIDIKFPEDHNIVNGNLKYYNLDGEKK
tara:strand:+ start:666 stop:1202 length:537 start_codon:yes stop_codon:yes gene_type:complete